MRSHNYLLSREITNCPSFCHELPWENCCWVDWDEYWLPYNTVALIPTRIYMDCCVLNSIFAAIMTYGHIQGFQVLVKLLLISHVNQFKYTRVHNVSILYHSTLSYCPITILLTFCPIKYSLIAFSGRVELSASLLCLWLCHYENMFERERDYLVYCLWFSALVFVCLITTVTKTYYVTVINNDEKLSLFCVLCNRFHFVLLHSGRDSLLFLCVGKIGLLASKN